MVKKRPKKKVVPWRCRYLLYPNSCPVFVHQSPAKTGGSFFYVTSFMGEKKGVPIKSQDGATANQVGIYNL